MSMTREQTDRVENLKRRLTQEPDVFKRIAMYNDPANGSIAERVIAATEYKRTPTDANA